MDRREQLGPGLGAVDLIATLLLLFILWMIALREFPRLDRKASNPPAAPTPTAVP